MQIGQGGQMGHLCDDEVMKAAQGRGAMKGIES